MNGWNCNERWNCELASRSCWPPATQNHSGGGHRPAKDRQALPSGAAGGWNCHGRKGTPNAVAIEVVLLNDDFQSAGELVAKAGPRPAAFAPFMAAALLAFRCSARAAADAELAAAVASEYVRKQCQQNDYNYWHA